MSQFLSIFVSILEVIVILGVLISLHEAGHLAAAKAFHVYCFEYSVGFGPKILKKKRKTGETYFCIGVIPLGGYVSMYGEEGAVPDGIEEPALDRSLKAKKKWQQAIIMVAGVTVNFILGLILIFVSDIAFPQYYYAYSSGTIESNSTTVSASFAPVSHYGDDLLNQIRASIEGNEAIKDDDPNKFALTFPATLYEGTNEQAVFFTDDVTIEGSSSKYVAAYYPSSLIDKHSLSSSLLFYPASEIDADNEYFETMHQKLGLDYLVAKEDVKTANYYNVKNAADGTKVLITMNVLPLSQVATSERSKVDYADIYQNKSATITVTFEAKDGAWVSSNGQDLEIDVISDFLGWSGAWSRWAQDVPRACGAIVQGIGSLFTGGIENLSGIVGITAAMPTITTSGGAAGIFFFAGMLSINLAFFNLLPFPGLDGWQLLTLGIEAIFRKEIPPRIKNIVSLVGLALLFGLMIFITIKDIVGLIR